MANVDAYTGFKPVGHLFGLDWNAQLRRCFMTGASGATYIGDAVLAAGSADATGAYPTISPSTANTDVIFGVVIGFEPDPNDLSLLYRKNSTDRYALVCVDPYVIWEIQASTDGVITKDSVMANANIIYTHSGSTTTGLSGMEMSSAVAPAADATRQLMILGCVDRSNNDITAVNAKWNVLITRHRLLPNYSNGAYFGALGV